MKYIIITITILTLGFTSAFLLIPNGTETSYAEDNKTKQQYTCGMHPEIISDEPGYCPICEMKLTPRKEGNASAGTVTIDPVTRQNMGLVTLPATFEILTRKVRASGKITFAEPSIHSVNLKFDGWIERLYVDHEGERVVKGQPMIEIYSPALVASQKEYLLAMKSEHNSTGYSDQNQTDILNASQLRLQNWDISEDQIEQLKTSGEISRTLVISAPADGVIVSKSVSEGDHLKSGSELYKIADLSTVWVVASIYEQDLPFVKIGQKAVVHLPNTSNEKYEATVVYISPFLDARRQAEVRLNVNNSDYQLKPEMYTEVTITSTLSEERLVIPRSAVINSGDKQVVYVTAGDDSFQPRIISTGATGDNDVTEVLSGIKENEQVVVSGQFLLDSESRLNEALAGGFQNEHNHEPDINTAEDDVDPDEFVAVGGHDIYTCPMPEHYHVLQYGEGTCSECNMKLVPLEDTDNKQVYVCPMTQCGVVKDHKGTCDVCGMNLVRYRPEDNDDR